MAEQDTTLSPIDAWTRREPATRDVTAPSGLTYRIQPITAGLGQWVGVQFSKKGISPQAAEAVVKEVVDQSRLHPTAAQVPYDRLPAEDTLYLFNAAMGYSRGKLGNSSTATTSGSDGSTPSPVGTDNGPATS